MPKDNIFELINDEAVLEEPPVSEGEYRGGAHGKCRSTVVEEAIIAREISKGNLSPKSLRKAAQLRNVAEVKKIFNKLAMREQYMQSIDRFGMNMDWVVAHFLRHIENTADPKVSLDALKAFIKTIGLDKYEDNNEASKSWEDTLKQAVKAEESGEIEAPDEEYEVIMPKRPDETAALDEAAKSLGEELG